MPRFAISKSFRLRVSKKSWQSLRSCSCKTFITMKGVRINRRPQAKTFGSNDMNDIYDMANQMIKLDGVGHMSCFAPHFSARWKILISWAEEKVCEETEKELKSRYGRKMWLRGNECHCSTLRRLAIINRTYKSRGRTRWALLSKQFMSDRTGHWFWKRLLLSTLMRLQRWAWCTLDRRIWCRTCRGFYEKSVFSRWSEEKLVSSFWYDRSRGT